MVMGMLWADARNTAAGLGALLRALRRQLPIPTISLSTFEAASVEIRAGEETTYRLLISQADRAARWIALRIDVQAVEDPTPRGHHAGLRKELLLPSRGAHAVVLTCDWVTRASFSIAGLDLEPDATHRGEAGPAGACFVSAAIFARDGGEIERLVLRQRIRT